MPSSLAASKRVRKPSSAHDLVYATSQTARSSFARPVKDAVAANDHKAWQFIEKAVERALKAKKM